MSPITIPSPHLLLMCCALVCGKPSPRSNPKPAPWDWQAGEQVDYAKYNMYEQEMKKMLEQPYFARVNNKTTIKMGEVAFLPCRVKQMGDGYTVSGVKYWCTPRGVLAPVPAHKRTLNSPPPP